MGEEKKRLPVGVENFEQIINDNYYYVDKTKLISELFHNGGMVNLITRPRRFGKTLNMSMLEHFFSIGGDKNIFDGLEISKDKKLCEDYMGKYPVISVSLKGINAAAYEDAFDFAVQIMKNVAGRTQFLLESRNLSDFDKSEYKKLLDSRMSKAVFCSGLKILSELLEKHYGTKVILLIDEYDVPLAKAFENGYYDQMVFLIRNLLEQALKTNNSLKFAVMTGCMRISKESIFTGLNNFTTFTITDVDFDEYFGFTEEEVCLQCEQQDMEYAEVKRWYDGYLIGNLHIYNPKSVVDALTWKELESYWTGTETYEALKIYIDLNFDGLKEAIAIMIGNGRCLIDSTTFQNDMTTFKTRDDVLTLLVHLGYLTYDRKTSEVFIPNQEIEQEFMRAMKVGGWEGIIQSLNGSARLLEQAD